ncbi:hypothetical protein AVEN_3550-1 [Araneus ventricosus]|uniref:Uncharacterized protein n=1 Tax=Araneus ventricosus TaxID=182803 RepID=A0A4Y2QUW0_ARAVE|nr:hypothetical protein AVEN_3550-1 [Araneus ventricosus]
MTRSTPELAPPSPSFHATPTGGRLATTYDLTCNGPHTRRIFSGIGSRTRWLQSRDLTTRPPRPRVKGGRVVRSRLWDSRVPGSKPDSTEDPPCRGLLHAKANVVAKRPPASVVWKFGEEVRAHVLSSSSDHSS